MSSVIIIVFLAKQNPGVQSSQHGPLFKTFIPRQMFIDPWSPRAWMHAETLLMSWPALLVFRVFF